MLEIFFDNDKVFSFFEAILRERSEKVNCFEILFKLGVDEDKGAEILNAFVFLGILDETDELRKGIFKFNAYAPITLGLCFFDEFVGNYCKQSVSNKGEKDNDISIEDFIEFIEKNGQEISFDEMIDLLKENGSL